MLDLHVHICMPLLTFVLVQQPFFCRLTTARSPLHAPGLLSRLLYFQELQGRAKQREQDEAERKRRAQDKFASLLRHLRKLDADTTWDQFLDDYDREPEYRAVSGDR